MGSKLKQGWLNLLNNEKQLFSTTRNVNNISRIRSTIKHNPKKKHIECQSSRMKKDERAVQDIETCLEEFDTKTFEASNPVLRTLQSTIAASNEPIADLKKAISERDEQIISFLNERVYSKTSSIRETIPKNKMIKFSNDYNYRVVKKEKVNQMEKDGQISMLNLGEKSNLIDLVELFVTELLMSVLLSLTLMVQCEKLRKVKL